MRQGKIERKGILFLTPSLVGVGVFVLFPYIQVILRSFGAYDLVPGIGTEYYRMVIRNEAFQLAVVNSVVFLGISLPLLMILSLVFAYGMFLSVRKTYWIQTGLILPMLLPVSTVVLLWQFLFHKNGFISSILGYETGQGVDWIASGYAMAILVFWFLWKNLGFAIVFLLEGILMLPPDMLQAGKMDGAGAFNSFRYLIIPQITGHLLCVMILAVVDAFKIYREIYLLAGEYPSKEIYMIQHVFNNWFRELRVEELAAGAVLMLGFFLILLLFIQKICDRKGIEL